MQGKAIATNFKDGKRRIDYILSYKQTAPMERLSNKDSIKIRRRNFELALKEFGLELEEESSQVSEIERVRAEDAGLFSQQRRGYGVTSCFSNPA